MVYPRSAVTFLTGAKLWYTEGSMVIEEDFIDGCGSFAGCDEVGRGPLAGPVVGACALLSVRSAPRRALDFLSALKRGGVGDSKKLSAVRRRRLIKGLGCRDLRPAGGPTFTLEENDFFSLRLAIAGVSHSLIDEINILRASLLAMSRSFSLLHGDSPAVVLIDGNASFLEPRPYVREVPIVKGDSKSVLIALASIFAKEYRDSLMGDYAKEYPRYGFDRHAGYPTKRHREAIAKYGATPIHRRSFKGVKEFL